MLLVATTCRAPTRACMQCGMRKMHRQNSLVHLNSRKPVPLHCTKDNKAGSSSQRSRNEEFDPLDVLQPATPPSTDANDTTPYSIPVRYSHMETSSKHPTYPHTPTPRISTGRHWQRLAFIARSSPPSCQPAVDTYPPAPTTRYRLSRSLGCGRGGCSLRGG